MAGRTQKSLETAISAIEGIKEEKLPRLATTAKSKQFNTDWAESLEIENMLIACEMTLRGGLARTESRGAHFREDFPRMDPELTKNIVVAKNGEGMSVEAQPVALTYVKPKGA